MFSTSHLSSHALNTHGQPAKVSAERICDCADQRQATCNYMFLRIEGDWHSGSKIALCFNTIRDALTQVITNDCRCFSTPHPPMH